MDQPFLITMTKFIVVSFWLIARSVARLALSSFLADNFLAYKTNQVSTIRL